MTIEPGEINGKSIAELDAIINGAIAAKQALSDAKIDELLGRIESECDALDITPRQLLAIVAKRKRKSRKQKEDSANS